MRKLRAFCIMSFCTAGDVAVIECARAQNLTFNEPVIGSLSSNGSEKGSDKLSVTPRFSSAWDNNALRRNPDSVNTSPDNVRNSPSIDLSLRQVFGRTRVSARAIVGYDFNSRFKFLDRERVVGDLNFNLPISAQCPIQISGHYERSQFDLNDTDQLRSSTRRIAQAAFDVRCSKAGLSPSFGSSVQQSTNSAYSLADVDSKEAHVAVQLKVPSIGAVLISAQIAEMNRPNAGELLGRKEQTRIYRYYLALERDVARHFSLNGKIGYSRAIPSEENIKSAAGLYVDAQLKYRLSQSFDISVSGLRDVQESLGLSANYVIRREVRASATYSPGLRTSITGGAGRSWRNYFGTELSNAPDLSKDKVDSAQFAITRRVGSKVTITAVAVVQRRRADDDDFNYKSRLLGINLGMKL